MSDLPVPHSPFAAEILEDLLQNVLVLDDRQWVLRVEELQELNPCFCGKLRMVLVFGCFSTSARRSSHNAGVLRAGNSTWCFGPRIAAVP